MYISPFVASNYDVVRKMLSLVELKPKEVLYDLGCGDGRIVIMAAQDFGAKAVGVELREDLAKRALENVLKLHLEDQVKIIHENLFNVDVSSADVVTLYLTTSANEKIRPKLEKELKPGTRVVSHDYEIRRWKPYKAINFCENKNLGYPTHKIYCYIVPEYF